MKLSDIVHEDKKKDFERQSSTWRLEKGLCNLCCPYFHSSHVEISSSDYKKEMLDFETKYKKKVLVCSPDYYEGSICFDCLRKIVENDNDN